MSWPWSELGLEGPASLPEIRRAYARRLKTTHPEEDPEGFQRLHDAYETACGIARGRWRPTPLSRLEGNEEQKREDGPDPFQPEAEAEQDWDYTRLFAQAAEEEREAARRKMEERRRRSWERYKAQEEQQRRSAEAEERIWAAVSAGLHALELLWSTGAPLHQWQQFLKSEVFLGVRANLDFLFGLEDFVEANPHLPQEIRQAIALAYGFERGPWDDIYRPLYRLLNVKLPKTWRAKAFWVPILIGAILIAVMIYAYSLSSQGEAEPSQWEAEPSQWEAERQREFWQDRLCAYFQEDYGAECTYYSAQDINTGGESLFYVDNGEDTFWIYGRLEGERDLAQGRRGYVTNYPGHLMMEAMRDFALERGLELAMDGMSFVTGLGQVPKLYGFDLPLYGAEEEITALGELLDGLSQAGWYQIQPPEFVVLLSHRDLGFYQYDSSSQEPFDGDYARAFYQVRLAPAVVRYLVEHSGLARLELGEDAYVLLEEGTGQFDGMDCLWISGREKPPSNRPVRYYLFITDSYSRDTDTATVYSVPYYMAEQGYTGDAEAELLQLPLEELDLTLEVWSYP